MRAFISYSRQDSVHAMALYEGLAEAGHEPWLDLVDIPSGVPWLDQIEQAIRKADVFLLIASPWSFASENVRREWEEARQQGKKTLLLLVESLRGDGRDFVPMGQPWIDLRARPLESVRQVLAWLSDQRIALTEPLPLRPRFPFFCADTVPPVVHFTAWALLIAGIVRLVLSGLTILALTVKMPSTGSLHLAGTGRLLSFSLITLNLIALYQGGETVRFGVLTYYRQIRSPVDQLRAEGLRSCVLALCSLFYAATVLLLGPGLDSARLLEPSFPVSGYGIASLALGVTTLVLSRMLRHDNALRRWSPTYDSDLLDTVVFVRSILGRTKEWRPQERYDAAPIEHADAKLIAEGDQPIDSVSVLYSQQDVPFAGSLAAFLVRQGIQVNGNQSDARDGAVVVVITRWSMNDPHVIRRWQRAMDADLPIVPVLLEDAQVPPALARLNWIDARDDLSSARQDVVDVIAGKPFPLRPQSTPRAPQRRSIIVLPTPKQIEALSDWVLLFPFALKMAVLILFYGTALWNNRSIPAWLLLVGGVMFLVGYIQSIAVGAFLARSLSYRPFAVVQVLSAFFWLTLMAFTWPALQQLLAFGLSTCLVLILLALAEGIPLVWLVSRPEYQEWAMGGWTFVPQRIPPLFWVSGPLVFLLGLVTHFLAIL